MKLRCDTVKTNMTTSEDETNKSPTWSETMENYPAINVREMYKATKNQMDNELANYIGKGSGWRLKEVIQLEVKIHLNRPLRGSSYVD